MAVSTQIIAVRKFAGDDLLPERTVGDAPEGARFAIGGDDAGTGARATGNSTTAGGGEAIAMAVEQP